ncbi:hypothetical protein BBJ28_00012693 [Nothophytophthora sp. Chile5]|nr:hypothetical protein BBJ28_00012693 [Nothophytophthora sp. Chile5]
MEDASDARAARSSPRLEAPRQAVAAFKTLDVFPSVSPPSRGSGAAPRTPSRRSLARLPLVFTLPSAAPDREADGSDRSSSFLAALRAHTLLDMTCMREFSLLRSKPMAERNLSRLSVTSAYSIHAEQLQLQQLASRPPPQADGNAEDARDGSGVVRRAVHTHRKVSAASGPVGTASNEPGRGLNEAKRTFPGSPPVRKGELSILRRPRSPKARPSPRFRAASPPSSRSTPLTVTEQHGFLQEQDLQGLMAATGYSRVELFARWARFKALCSLAKSPQGVDKDTLRRGVPQLSVEDQFFIDRAFDVLDSDGSGALDWPEFVAALSALEKGDAARRVDFLFRAYDLNGDGFIQRQDVQQFFLASLLVPPTAETLEVARNFVEKIFLVLGREQHDSIRVQDAMRYLRDHPAADAYRLLGRTMVSTAGNEGQRPAKEL